MGLFKKIKNKNKEQDLTEHKNEIIQDEKYVNTVSKKIITTLKIAESMLYSMEYKLTSFSSLTDKEVEYIYDNIHSIKQNVIIYKEFATKHNLTDSILKADDLLEKIENMIYIMNNNLTGIIY